MPRPNAWSPEEAGIIQSSSIHVGFSRPLQQYPFSLDALFRTACAPAPRIFSFRAARALRPTTGKKSFDEVRIRPCNHDRQITRRSGARGYNPWRLQNEATIKRVNDARGLGRCAAIHRLFPVAGYEKARTASPLVSYRAKNEMPGRRTLRPDAFLIKTESTGEGIRAGPLGPKRCDHRVDLFHERADHPTRRQSLCSRRPSPCRQSHRRSLRQPIGGVLRLSRRR